MIELNLYFFTQLLSRIMPKFIRSIESTFYLFIMFGTEHNLFVYEQALIKLIYLAVDAASRKWTMRHRNWTMIYSQLIIFFKDRLAKYV